MVTQAFGENQLKEAKPSPWMDNRVRFKLEETLYFLIQANAEAAKLPEENRYKVSTSIQDATTSSYTVALHYLKIEAHPQLLEDLLKHHKEYLTGSACEELAECIEEMKKMRLKK